MVLTPLTRSLSCAKESKCQQFLFQLKFILATNVNQFLWVRQHNTAQDIGKCKFFEGQAHRMHANWETHWIKEWQSTWKQCNTNTNYEYKEGLWKVYIVENNYTSKNIFASSCRIIPRNRRTNILPRANSKNWVCSNMVTLTVTPETLTMKTKVILHHPTCT